VQSWEEWYFRSREILVKNNIRNELDIEESYEFLSVPYAISEGMVSFRFSFKHMPWRPWSQPLITWPIPTGIRTLVRILLNDKVEAYG
jgi:hypothetical protein